MNDEEQAIGRGCSDDRLAMLAGGDLSAAEEAVARAHVRGCERCARTSSEMVAALSWARAVEAPFSSRQRLDFEQSVLAAAATMPKGTWKWKWTSRWAAFTGMFRRRPADHVQASWRWAAVPVVVAAAALFATLQTPDRPGTMMRDAGAPARLSSLPGPVGAAPLADAPRPATGSVVSDEPTASDGDDHARAADTIKIEMRTRDPKIRIIWLAQR